MQYSTILVGRLIARQANFTCGTFLHYSRHFFQTCPAKFSPRSALASPKIVEPIHPSDRVISNPVEQAGVKQGGREQFSKLRTTEASQKQQVATISSLHNSINHSDTGAHRGKGLRKSKNLNKKPVDLGRSRHPCHGYASADQYENMSKLHTALAAEYVVHHLPEDVGSDAIYCSIRSTGEPQAALPAFRKDFVVFWDGVVVFWNCSKEEQTSLLELIRPFERGPHPPQLVESEVEHVEYLVADGGPARVVNNTIILNPSCTPLAISEADAEIEPSVLTKFAISEAVRLSVRLAIWENQVITLAESVDGVIDDLRGGRRLRISRSDVLRHCGDLLLFRHRVNLASDLLQTPDFYWDRPQLEELFRRTRSFLNVPHRTRLVNEKLNHCFELVELLRSHLNDSHHIRLEWMIIALICIEVVFDAIPTLGRFFMP